MFVTKTGLVVKAALDGLATRHRVFANNLANLETPGFQPSDLPFEAELRELRDRLASDPATIRRVAADRSSPGLTLAVVPDDQETYRADGNGVQADRQMIRLQENSLTYEAVAQATRMRGELLRAVLTDGRA
jgi:flagellar basal-body rod protein FlgB